MNSLSPKTASLPGWTDPAPGLSARIGRMVVLAQGALAVERLLPAMWPALGFVCIYVALGLLGLFGLIPWTLQALLLAATITATGLALEAGLQGFAWPRWRDGARRLERANNLKHRPISESQDRLVGADPLAQTLWHLHRARPLPGDGLKWTWPRPDFSRRDPLNLRYAALLALAVGLVVARGDTLDRLARLFDSGAGAAIGLDAWVTPPAYTDLPPVYLSRGADRHVAVPFGSALHLRVHGAERAPGATLGDASPPSFAGTGREYSAIARLAHDSHLRVRASGHVIGDWRLSVIPDKAPVIAFNGLPSATEHAAVRFAFKASDDYGVVSVKAVLTPHGRGGQPLVVNLPLAGTAKTLTSESFVDLTGHPYAGLLVDARLEARDALGQQGQSRPVTFRLPARVFTDPLARALIEQRQNLATASDRAQRRRVAEALDALALAPAQFYAGKPALYLGLRAAYWGVRTVRQDGDVDHVEALLWQIAVSLEQNGLLDAAAELRRLEQLLNQALAAHAPQDVIDQLLQRYNQAMQRYMQALANAPQGAQPPMQNAQTAQQITPNDLNALLKAIQELSRSGNRAAAAQMLAMLQSMLENLHMSASPAQNQSAQQKAMNQAMQKLSGLMAQERALLDKTMRQGQQGGQQKGQPKGQQGQGPLPGLGRMQGQIQSDTGSVAKELGPEHSGALGDAGQAMAQAQHALQQGDLDNAANAEKNALRALDKTAEQLSKQMDKAAGTKGANGREDPLGRDGSQLGNSVKIPGVTDLARTRAILEELRRRAAQRGRPREELDYIDRLLREF